MSRGKSDAHPKFLANIGRCRVTKNILKNFKIPLDKLHRLCYNRHSEREVPRMENKIYETTTLVRKRLTPKAEKVLNDFKTKVAQNIGIKGYKGGFQCPLLTPSEFGRLGCEMQKQYKKYGGKENLIKYLLTKN